MSDANAVIAVFDTHSGADNAVKELQRSGFDMKKLSVVGKDFHTDEQVVGYYNAGDRMKYWGKAGAFWGGLWGLLVGGAFFWVPGVGPLLVAGPLAAWIVGALEGATVGHSWTTKDVARGTVVDVAWEKVLSAFAASTHKYCPNGLCITDAGLGGR